MVRRTSLTSTHCTRNYVFDERASGIKWRVGKEADTKNTAATAVRKEPWPSSLCLSTSRFPAFFLFSFFFHSLHFGFRVQRGEFKFFFFYYVVFIYLSVRVSFFLSSFPCENSREKIIRNVLVVVLFRMGRFLFCAWFTFFPQCFLVEHPFIEFNRL